MKKKLIKRENGAVATLVLFTVLMFIVILGGAYFTISTMQKSQIKSDMRIRDIYGKDVERVNEIYEELSAQAPYDKPYIPNEFQYKEGSWNSGYTIIGKQGTASAGNEFVWVPCVTNQSKVKEGDNVVTFGKTTTEKYNEANVELSPTDAKTQEDSTVNEIRESVEKYGGFYIAKYEAGVPLNADGTKETRDNNSLETKTEITEKPLSQEGCGLWNYITREDAMTVSKAMINYDNTGVKSTLISGEAWDTTLQWMVNASDNKENEPNKEYDINSKGKGWYIEAGSSAKVHTTGYYSINNIYDMAGNVWEWTSENGKYNAGMYAMYRGGNSSWSGSDKPAACRGYITSSKLASIAFRVLLYK